MSLCPHQTETAEASREEGRLEPAAVQALTRAMVEGREAAYRAFYDAYFPRLLRYLLVVTRGEEEAAREALQAALVRVVRHIKVFPDETIFWNWLAVLARSALSDQGRKQRRYLAFLDRFTRHARVQHPAPAPDREDRLPLFLERSLALLPPDERDLLDRKYFARESVRQMAAELHATEKAIESRLTRVRQKLKQSILEALRHESKD